MIEYETLAVLGLLAFIAIVFALMIWAAINSESEWPSYYTGDPYTGPVHYGSWHFDDDPDESLTCNGTTADDKPCQRPVTDTDYCYMHEDQADN